MAISSLNIPSPEQGASTRIKSKKPCKPENADGSFLLITVFETPHFLMFSARIDALELITSFETSSPSCPIREERCVLLPPGAAQRSRTLRYPEDFATCLKTCSMNMPDAS